MNTYERLLSKPTNKKYSTLALSYCMFLIEYKKSPIKAFRYFNNILRAEERGEIKLSNME